MLDALDSETVRAALAKIRPDAVIDELTSLPKHYTPDEMRAASERDRKLRIECGGNVQKAATAARARRYVVQSTGFFYEPGPGLAAEDASLAVNAPDRIAATVHIYMEIERRVLGPPNSKASPCAMASSAGMEHTTNHPTEAFRNS